MGTDKRKEQTEITLGSVDVYITEYDGALPDYKDVCKAENHLAHTKGGATLTYNKEKQTVQDDFGRVRKTIIVSDELAVKFGLIAWNGNTLAKLESTAEVTEADGIRTTKIGGTANDNGKQYCVVLHHPDKQSGDCWWQFVGTNTAGFEFAYSADDATLAEPEFTASSMDNEGRLCYFMEEIGTATVG